jgi:predicted DCC family thiol-disulfide oxidoreductase YuxK
VNDNTTTPRHEPQRIVDGPLSLSLSPAKGERVPKAGEGAVQGCKARMPSGNSFPERGSVYYDAECGFCRAGARRGSGLFERRGFRWLPLQTPGTPARLGLTEAALREEMKLWLTDGRVLGGVDAWAVLFRSVWWLWPLGVALRIPGLHWVANLVYRWVARHRYALAGQCRLSDRKPSRHDSFFRFP